MTGVITTLAPIRSVKYSEILALDQKIREYNPQEIFSSSSLKPDSETYSTRLQDMVREVQLGLLKDMSELHALDLVLEDVVSLYHVPTFHL